MKEFIEAILPWLTELRLTDENIKKIESINIRHSYTYDCTEINLRGRAAVQYAIARGVVPGEWYAFNEGNKRPQRNWIWFEANIKLSIIETHVEAGFSVEECHAQNGVGHS